MRAHHLTTSTALAAVALLFTSLSTASNGVLASSRPDPLYSGAGSRSHGYRSDLAAAVIAHNNKLRASAAARVAAAAVADADSHASSPPREGPPSDSGPHPSAASSHAPECVSIESTHSCAPWTTGYYINSTELALVYGLSDGTAPDAAYWDKLVEAMTGGGELQAAIWAEWAQCLGYHGSPIQYYRSYVCLTDVFFYSAGCNPGTKISPPLHPDVCDVYKEAVAGLVQDPNACPSLDSLSETLQGPALQDVFDRRTFLLSADESCRSILNSYAQSSDASVWGVTADQNSCGFGGNVTVAKSYCDDVFAQYHQKPKCCDSLDAGSSSGSSHSSSFAPPSHEAGLRAEPLHAAGAEAGSESQSTTEGPNVGAIVGGSVGGLVVVGGAVAAFLATKRKPKSGGSKGPAMSQKMPFVPSATKDIETGGGPSSDYVMLPPGSRYVGILEFQPTHPDEMEVNEGDIIEGKVQYSDGWMKGYNHESQETGLFPSAVVKPLNS